MQQSKKVILSIAYFPPIQYFSKIISNDNVLIESNENFVKQSYRNRCEIMSSNGIQILSIPVVKLSGEKQKIKDVKIDYKNDWQSLHLKSINSAYLSSPFFEYYIDSIMFFFNKQFTFLFDLNSEILHSLLKELQISAIINQTDIYENDYKCSDFRHTIHPKEKFKKEDTNFTAQKYTQVFFDRYDFVPNLSILDLLFNEGPNTENILRQSVSQ